MFKDIIITDVKRCIKTTKDISNMTWAQKRKYISIRNANIIKKIKLGAKQIDLAEAFGLSTQRLSEICRNENRRINALVATKRIARVKLANAD